MAELLYAVQEQRVEHAGRFGSFGLNCDEQAALIANMRADKKLQRLLQVEPPSVASIICRATALHMQVDRRRYFMLGRTETG